MLIINIKVGYFIYFYQEIQMDLSSYQGKCNKLQHSNKPIILICLQEKCEQNLLCCEDCVDESHKRHELVSLRKFERIIKQKFSDRTNPDRKAILKMLQHCRNRFLNILKSIQNQFLSKLYTLENEISKVFLEVSRTLSISKHQDIINQLLRTFDTEGWEKVLEDFKLVEKHQIGTKNDTSTLLQHQLNIFSLGASQMNQQLHTLLEKLENQIKTLKVTSKKALTLPYFHQSFKSYDIIRSDNSSIVEKKKNSGNRTAAFINFPLDPVNNTVRFKIISNGEGIPSICIGAAILQVVKKNNFTNCTGNKRGVYSIDQATTTSWGSIQASNEATAWNNESNLQISQTIGFQFTEGDTVEMCIDYLNEILIFQLGQQMYDMQIDCSHRNLFPFVSLYNSGSIVQILNGQ